MSISFEILGSPGRDNALLVHINSGQSLHRLLFDCGEGCLNDVSFAELQAIDHLFFSHFHMDHVAGFDHFFRAVFNRTSKPNRIWGPAGTRQIMQHRFRGYLWNLHGEMNASWEVSEIDANSIRTSRYELSEAFEIERVQGTRDVSARVLDTPDYSVDAFVMDHRTPSLAYIVREKSRVNVDTSRLAALGLRPGPWMKELKEAKASAESVVIGSEPHLLEDLRQSLLIETPGESVAYLTDFLLDDAAIERLAPHLAGCRTMVCEAQYREADLDLANRNFHMTTGRSAELAKRADVEQLILFHLSDRYQLNEWTEMLAEAKERFPNTVFPPNWSH